MANTPAKKKTTASPTPSAKSKPLPVGIKIAIGCVGILIILGILMGVAGNILFSKIGLNFMKKGIEQKTGISMDTAGKSLTLKDSKTGAEVNFGGEAKIPAGFPKDFPLYPGATVEGNVSGVENQAGKGFWLILGTKDDAAKVTAFYTANLPKNGWTVSSTMNLGPSSTWEITKGDTSGSVIVGSDEKTKGASIVVSLSPKE